MNQRASRKLTARHVYHVCSVAVRDKSQRTRRVLIAPPHELIRGSVPNTAESRRIQRIASTPEKKVRLAIHVMIETVFICYRFGTCNFSFH